MEIDVTVFGLPILLTSGSTLYPISFLGGFFPHSLSLFLYYDVNRTGRPKAVTFIPIFLGHYRQLLSIPYIRLYPLEVPGYFLTGKWFQAPDIAAVVREGGDIGVFTTLVPKML